MEKVQRNWAEISAELEGRLAKCKMSPQALSTDSGADYHAILRFKKRGVKNASPNAKKLCNFFGIEEIGLSKLQSALADKVVDAWDGTAPHAELIVKLVQSAKAFKVAPVKSRASKKRRRKTG